MAADVVAAAVVADAADAAERFGGLNKPKAFAATSTTLTYPQQRQKKRCRETPHKNLEALSSGLCLRLSMAF